MLAIIGGTGLYDIEGLSVLKEFDIDTPFGAPSAPIIQAKLNKQDLLFLPRHGKKHQFLPHEINYRANIYSLKTVGATHVVGFSAVGSLREDIHPGDFVIPSQYFDFIKGNRDRTFFGEGLAAHVSTALPVCNDLTSWLAGKVSDLDMTAHQNKTYVCVDGPRLGTQAESHFFRSIDCDIVGMSNIPEVFLAREAQLCYASVCMVTDYDCWKQSPAEHVSVSAIMQTYAATLKKANRLLWSLFQDPLPETNTAHRASLKDAVLTQTESLTPAHHDLLRVLRK